jgi:recombination protein RecT
MATATQQRPQAATQPHEMTPQEANAILLHNMVQEADGKEKPAPRQMIAKALRVSLLAQIGNLETVLPPAMKGQAERLIQRALVTFSEKSEMQECTGASVLRCILRAAEVGLMIDGKLAHAAPFNCNIGTKSSPKYEKQAQLLIDWKGLAALALRSGRVKRITPDTVCEADEFEAWRDGPTNHLVHKPPRLGSNRGATNGYYVVIVLPEGDWDFETMTRREVDEIRSRSPSADSPAWKNYFDEMGQKTVLKRGLKGKVDDPAYNRAVQIDEEEFEGVPVEKQNGHKLTRRSLPDNIAPAPNGNRHHEAVDESPPPETEGIDPPAPADVSQEQPIDPAVGHDEQPPTLTRSLILEGYGAAENMTDATNWANTVELKIAKLPEAERDALQKTSNDGYKASVERFKPAKKATAGAK